ncbi:MAG: winged helix-turn-helix transcriptional regulator [Gammaproteobacteria bacterium]|nr:winged helix-turn-helix transcriptional regulator [Gammaproteobacteria bacterium]
MDAIDKRILRELQKNGKVTNVELASRVNLSPTPCLERVKKLENRGIIQGYHAKLDADLLGLGLVVFVQIILNRTTTDIFDKFATRVKKLPEVLECHMVAGGFDYLLKLRFQDMIQYRRFHGEQLANMEGVLQTHTYIVMEQIKETTSLGVK